MEPYKRFREKGIIIALLIIVVMTFSAVQKWDGVAIAVLQGHIAAFVCCGLLMLSRYGKKLVDYPGKPRARGLFVGFTTTTAVFIAILIIVITLFSKTHSR